MQITLPSNQPQKEINIQGYDSVAENAFLEIINEARSSLMQASEYSERKNKNDFYISLITNLNKELIEDVTNVFQAICQVTHFKEIEFYDKIEDVYYELSKVPSSSHKEKIDKNLCIEANRCIALMKQIANSFIKMNGDLVIQLDELGKEICFSSFKAQLMGYHELYKEHTRTINYAIRLGEKWLKKIKGRIEEDKKGYFPSEISCTSYSHAIGPSLSDVQNGLKDFHLRTENIIPISENITKTQAQMNDIVALFKSNYCYLAYLCAYRCRPSQSNSIHFAAWYKVGYYTYLEENLQFSTDGCFIDQKYSQGQNLKIEFLPENCTHFANNSILIPHSSDQEEDYPKDFSKNFDKEGSSYEEIIMSLEDQKI
ncbi:MAG: hypothetical protein H0V82_03160 [Candidatus Protochlamydia sp.]|nr:hypothetical protein [Candidatus Protochlamydia sp.]